MLHHIRVVMLHIRVICFERMATWKGCYDMRKVCQNIFEGCNVWHKLNVKHISSRNLRLYDDIYIGIYTESFKNTHSYLLHFLLQNTYLCVK